MNEDKIYEYIDKLALNFNTTAEHVSEVVIKQAYFSSIIGTSIGLFALSLGVILLMVLRNDLKKFKRGDSSLFYKNGYHTYTTENTVRGNVLIGVVIASMVIGVLTTPPYIYDLITVIFNPDYVIIKELKNLF